MCWGCYSYREANTAFKKLLSFKMVEKSEDVSFQLTLLHSEWPKLYRVSATLSAIGLKNILVLAGAHSFLEE